jgi:hypothetical protein
VPAETGACEPVSYRIEGDRTFVPLALAPDESVYVVFRKPPIVILGPHERLGKCVEAARSLFARLDA